MEPFKNVTVEEYGIWLIRTLDQANDPTQIAELQRIYEDFVQEISYLERCFNLPSYAPDRSL